MAAKQQKQERSFGLSSESVKELAEEYAKTKRLPNCYRSGAYGFTLDALVALGANKPHPLSKVHTAFKKAAGADWYSAWASAEKRNEETGKDADGKFLTNLKVLQRTADYGLKLLQVGQKVLKSKGAVIDISRDDKGGLLVALNLNSKTPLKPGRAERPTKPTAQKAVKASRKAQDGRKASGSTGRTTKGGKKPRKAGKARTEATVAKKAEQTATQAAAVVAEAT